MTLKQNVDAENVVQRADSPTMPRRTSSLSSGGGRRPSEMKAVTAPSDPDHLQQQKSNVSSKQQDSELAHQAPQKQISDDVKVDGVTDAQQEEEEGEDRRRLLADHKQKPELHMQELTQEDDQHQRLLKRRPTWRQTWEELHRQSHMGGPIAVTNVLWFARFLASTAFLGHLGGMQLAAGTLALTFANVLGFSVLLGLASGMEPVCSQAFGSRRWDVLAATLRRGAALLLLVSVPVAAAWLRAEPLLLLAGQNPAVARAASRYLLYLLPDLFATSLLAPLRVFLRSQCITKPLMVFSLLALSLHIPVNYLLVFRLRMGGPGTAVAICVTDFALVAMLLLYVRSKGILRKAMDNSSSAASIAVSGRGSAPMAEWRQLLKLAVPSCLMTCMEGWCYEIMVLLTGLLPQDTKEAMETVAIVLNGDTVLYALQMAMASCVCTRVGNELGARRPVGAYHATVAALSLATAMGCAGAAWLASSRHVWGRFFTSDAKVIRGVSQVLPVMALMEMANFPQTVACGVLRGSARPAMGALINLGSFYLLGIPMALLLGFKYQMGLLGLWIGLATAVTATAVMSVAVVLRTDWMTQGLPALHLKSTAPINGSLDQYLYDSLSASSGLPSSSEHRPSATTQMIMEPLKYLEAAFQSKQNGDDKTTTRTRDLSFINGDDGIMKDIHGRRSLSRLASKVDEFPDAKWALLRSDSGRQIAALAKPYDGPNSEARRTDDRCWEVSMSMMNESMKKCTRMARLSHTTDNLAASNSGAESDHDDHKTNHDDDDTPDDRNSSRCCSPAPPAANSKKNRDGGPICTIIRGIDAPLKQRSKSKNNSNSNIIVASPPLKPASTTTTTSSGKPSAPAQAQAQAAAAAATAGDQHTKKMVFGKLKSLVSRKRSSAGQNQNQPQRRKST